MLHTLIRPAQRSSGSPALPSLVRHMRSRRCLSTVLPRCSSKWRTRGPTSTRRSGRTKSRPARKSAPARSLRSRKLVPATAAGYAEIQELQRAFPTTEWPPSMRKE